MKIALITDIHFGKMSDNDYLLDYYEKFLNQTFFPTLEKENINTVIDLGDIFDNRTKVNTKTVDRAKRMYFDKLLNNGISYHVILGNHDCHFPSTNDINTPSLVLNDYNNIRVFENATEVTHDGLNMLFLPWINKGNAEHTLETIKASNSKVAFGHLELAGFNYDKARIAKRGMNAKIFKKFDMVLSGHYHTKSTKGNITYLGSAFQHTWVDQGDNKFFHIFDTDTLELTPIRNPFTVFENIIYKEGMELDPTVYAGKFVKMFVDDIGSKTKLDKFCAEIENYAVKFDISYNHKRVTIEIDEQDQEIEIEDTMTIIKECVDDEDVLAILEKSYLENV